MPRFQHNLRQFLIGVTPLVLLVGIAVLYQRFAVPEPSRPVATKRPVPVSYELPARDVPESVRARLHPWIAGFIGLTPAEATRRLHQRWEKIERPSLVSLRKTLSGFEVRAIVDGGDSGKIQAVRPGSDEGIIGNSFYLPGPMEEAELVSRLESVGLAANRSVFEFMTHFAGLAEDAQVAGSFLYRESPWPTFVDSWEGSIQGFDEWKNSVFIYIARNGCCVLVHRSGKVGWWIAQERRTVEAAANFDEFVEQFSKHRELEEPFDPYVSVYDR
jgi:hypothetical protein